MECRCGGELRKFDQPARVETWFCHNCGYIVARLAQRPERVRGKDEVVGSNLTVGLWKS